MSDKHYDFFRQALNMVVSDYLNKSGDPSRCADILREVADDVFAEPEAGTEDDPIDTVRRANFLSPLTETACFGKHVILKDTFQVGDSVYLDLSEWELDDNDDSYLGPAARCLAGRRMHPEAALEYLHGQTARVSAVAIDNGGQGRDYLDLDIIGPHGTVVIEAISQLHVVGRK